MFKIGCDNGHKEDVVVPDSMSVEEFLKNHNCSTCGLPMKFLGYPR